MIDLITTEAAVAFLQVVMIDLVLAGDNAIVIGLAAAGLPPEQRTRAILIGIVAATVLRIAFAGVTTQLLQIVGLLFAGGILLLWVCWKMWRELRAASGEEPGGAAAEITYEVNADGTMVGRLRQKTFAAGGAADRRRRRLDVARQRAGGRGRGARASDGARLRPRCCRSP